MIQNESEMYRVLKNFPQQCKVGTRLAGGMKIIRPDSIIVSGMGASAFVGDVLKCYLGDIIPIYVNRNYSLPEFVSKKSVVFVISYSGNTEETLRAFKDARQRGCCIVGISSGGKLKALCKKYKIPYMSVPAGIQPRATLGYLFFPILTILQNSGLIKNKKKEIAAAIRTLSKSPFESKAKGIVNEIAGKIPIIYSSQQLYCLAMGWKTRINENAKIHTFWNVFPELNHNELSSYTSPDKRFYTIILRSKKDLQRVQLRADLTARLIKSRGGEVTVIDLPGSGLLDTIFFGLHLGDWVSYWLAMKYGKNPNSIVLQERFKQKLTKY